MVDKVVRLRPQEPALFGRSISKPMGDLLDRLAEEVGELQDAICSKRRAAVLDECVDVIYFAREIAKLHGIDDAHLTEYRMIKGWFRDAGVKDKAREMRVAAAVLDGRNSMEALQP